MLNKPNGFWASEKRCSAPRRIISTVPSQTELLSYFGFEQEVIGITLFCVHPQKWFKTKTRVGGTKKLNLQKIIDLKPDFILANKEENVKEQIEELAEHFPVYVTDVCHLQDAYNMMEEVGEILKVEEKASQLIKLIQTKFQTISKSHQRVGYFIWKNPYMTIGADTFISDVLLKAGFVNIFQNQNRYPEVTISEVAKQEPDLLFLSSEPYPFKENDVEELKDQLHCPIRLVDGELFSWYGSRLLHTPSYLANLIQALNLD